VICVVPTLLLALLWGCGLGGTADSACASDCDSDGYAIADGDCDDADPRVHPGAEDLAGDGLDADCSGEDGVDTDGDGHADAETGGADCDDTDPEVHPEAEEVAWDEVDQDCDGEDLHTWRFVAAQIRASCGITTTDEVLCWEGSQYHDPPDATFSSLTVGDTVLCGVLASTSEVTCWGGDTFDILETVPSDLVVHQVESDGDSFCAIRDPDRELVCWGVDKGGVLDPPTGTYTSVSCGSGPTCCAISEAGDLACWGADNYGILEDEPPEAPWAEVSFGIEPLCGITREDVTHCWGKALWITGEAPPADLRLHDIGVGRNHACALRDDATITCWGEGRDGQTTVP